MFSEPVVNESVDIKLFNSSVSADVYLTESGSIHVDLPTRIEVDPEQEAEDFLGVENIKKYNFSGTNSSNTQIYLQDALIHPGMDIGSVTKYFVNNITPREIIIDSSNGTAFVDKEITIQIDMMSFLPSNPQIDHLEDQPLLEYGDWSIYGYSMDDREDRVDLIKEYKRHLRTATIEIQQQINGPASRQVKKALDKLEPIGELVSFPQGVEPIPIRAQITKIDDQKYNERYEHWFSYYSGNIGHAFLGQNLSWGDLQDYLSESYEDYVDKRDSYRLNMILSWYLDSINTTRTVDARLASICSGIELFAKRYSDHGPEYTKTRDRIGYLVDTLDVETEDLAEFSGTYNSSQLDTTDNKRLQERSGGIVKYRYVRRLLDVINKYLDEGNPEYTHEYFYSYSRQYVVHGDNLKITDDELYRDHEAAHVLFQRLLRNQLLDNSNLDNYQNLKNLSAEDSRIM